MKIILESFDKENSPHELLAILAEKDQGLGSIPAKYLGLWQNQWVAFLGSHEKKIPVPDSEFFPNKEQSFLAIRLPKKKGLDKHENIRLASGSIFDAAKSRSLKRIAIALNQTGLEEIRSTVEGLFYAQYEFRKYKSEPAKNNNEQDFVLLIQHTNKKAVEKLLIEIQAIFNQLKLLRDLVNEPGSELDPEAFSLIAKKAGRDNGIKVTIRNENQLRKEGFLGLWTVGKGSDRPPRMVTLEYRGAPKNRQTNHLCIVGKGVTFDTGGISLKPSAGMAEMKCDMAGAATALAGICAVAALKLPMNMSAVLCLAENRPGNASVLPGDIFKARNGKTVMVDNTDAEGRLVLSDGLFEAGTLAATHIIDIATLTGSIVRALGPSMAGLFSNDRDFGMKIRDAGISCGEKFWEMPLEEEYREWFDDPVADMKNIGKSEAGAITAALFLAEFVPKGVKWAHWDVAGTAFITSPWKYFKPGSTGFGLKTLVEIAKGLV